MYFDGGTNDVVSHFGRLGVEWVHDGFLFEQEGTEVTERSLLRFLCYLVLRHRVQSPNDFPPRVPFRLKKKPGYFIV